MRKKVVEILLSKWGIIIGLGICGCAIVASLLGYWFVDQLPERQLVENYLRGNPTIKNEFGNILSISYGGDGSGVSFRSGGLEGYYSYIVKGEKKSGVVRVSWQSRGKGVDLVVKSIELLEPWKDPVVIWPDKE